MVYSTNTQVRHINTQVHDAMVVHTDMWYTVQVCNIRTVQTARYVTHLQNNTQVCDMLTVQRLCDKLRVQLDM